MTLGTRFIWLVVILVVIVSAGLGVLNFFLGRSLNEAEARLSSLQERRDQAFESQAIKLDLQLQKIKKLLEEHPNWSKVFKALEAATLPQVQFVSFTGSLGENTIVLSGKAFDYSTVGRQMRSFEEAEGFGSPQVTNLALGTDGRVQFNLRINFSSSLITNN